VASQSNGGAAGLDPLPLRDKVAIVTGGGRGIGAAISLALAQRGARVAIVYRSDSRAAEATRRLLPGDGHRTMSCDVSDPAAVEQLVEVSAACMGGNIDILVNNAGIYIDHDILDEDGVTYTDWQEAWDRTMRANVSGPANLCFCVGRHMAARGVCGRIVNVTSRGAFRGEPTAPAYGASKAALNSLSQSLAKALGTKGILVAAVAPGFVDTEMARGEDGELLQAALTAAHDSPFQRIATPEAVAEAVAFLASPGSTFSAGTIIDVNGASYFR
jgi:3-oxoacyl-[acyl-carrier protein] reductase